MHGKTPGKKPKTRHPELEDLITLAEHRLCEEIAEGGGEGDASDADSEGEEDDLRPGPKGDDIPEADPAPLGVSLASVATPARSRSSSCIVPVGDAPILVPTLASPAIGLQVDAEPPAVGPVGDAPILVLPAVIGLHIDAQPPVADMPALVGDAPPPVNIAVADLPALVGDAQSPVNIAVADLPADELPESGD